MRRTNLSRARLAALSCSCPLTAGAAKQADKHTFVVLRARRTGPRRPGRHQAGRRQVVSITARSAWPPSVRRTRTS